MIAIIGLAVAYLVGYFLIPLFPLESLRNAKH